jgi:O-antigen ligase
MPAFVGMVAEEMTERSGTGHPVARIAFNSEFLRNPVGLIFCVMVIAAIAVAASLDLRYALMTIAAAGLASICLLAVLDVKLALCLLIVSTVLNVSDVLSEFHGIQHVGKVLGAPFVIATAVLFWRRREAPQVDRSAIGLVLLYLATAVFSAVGAAHPDISLSQLTDLARNVFILILVIIAVRDVGTMQAALRSFYVPLAAISAACLVQAWTGYYGIDRTGFFQAEVRQIAGLVDSYRAQGPFADPNSFGRIIVAALPLALPDIVAPGRPRIWRVVAIVAVAALLGALLLTYSRGATFALLLVILICFWWFPRRWPILLVSTMVVISGVLTFAPAGFLDRIARIPIATLQADDTATTGDASIVNRLDEMSLALRMFAERPLSGVGLGNYKPLFQKYSLDSYGMPRQEDRQAHSFPLEIAAETGVLGLISFGAVLFAALYGTLFSAFPNEEQLWLARAAGLGVFAYFAASLFLHDDYSRVAWLLLAIALGKLCQAH